KAGRRFAAGPATRQPGGSDKARPVLPRLDAGVLHGRSPRGATPAEVVRELPPAEQRPDHGALGSVAPPPVDRREPALRRDRIPWRRRAVGDVPDGFPPPGRDPDPAARRDHGPGATLSEPPWRPG